MCQSNGKTRATLSHWLIILLTTFHTGLAFAHGETHQPNPWHKLEFWNGELHLFATVFWLAVAIAVVASVRKLIKKQRNRHD